MPEPFAAQVVAPARQFAAVMVDALHGRCTGLGERGGPEPIPETVQRDQYPGHHECDKGVQRAVRVGVTRHAAAIRNSAAPMLHQISARVADESSRVRRLTSCSISSSILSSG